MSSPAEGFSPFPFLPCFVSEGLRAADSIVVFSRKSTAIHAGTISIAGSLIQLNEASTPADTRNSTLVIQSAIRARGYQESRETHIINALIPCTSSCSGHFSSHQITGIPLPLGFTTSQVSEIGPAQSQHSDGDLIRPLLKCVAEHRESQLGVDDLRALCQRREKKRAKKGRSQ